MEPLIHHFSKHKKIPLKMIETSIKDKTFYNPITQTSIFGMGSKTTACYKSTDGTNPKNEADKVMDDN